MTRFKDLLVQLDHSKSCAARMKVAIDLARTHDAHLTSLYVLDEPELPGSVLGLLPEDVLAEQRRLLRERADAVTDRFREAAEREGVGVECRIDPALTPGLVATVALHARYADLAILGQVDPDDQDVRPIRPELVLMASGRPGLIVPYIGIQSRASERVMVAWDAGREATRALHDALPLLVSAQTVHILCVNPKTGIAAGHGAEPGADVARHLARHGVRAEVEQMQVGDELSVEDAILDRVADLGIDLIVAGAYGHSRLRELVLGGVTRRLLQSMTVPVLMSH